MKEVISPAAKQLRIAMLSVHSCPMGNLGAKDTGGMSIYIREIARELGKQGHQVDVYTRVHDPSDPQIVPLGRNARLVHLPAGDNGNIDKLALYLHLPDFACNLERYRNQNNLKYDLLFNHYWLSAWAGRYLKQWWHVPDINMFHTLGAVKNTFRIGTEETDLRIETERELVRDSDRIIATTAVGKDNLRLYYDAPPQRIGVIPCGVNMELFHPLTRETARRQLGFTGGKIVLFVGRLDPLKGIDQLIRALPLLPREMASRLVVIGGDETSATELARLQSLTAEMKVSDSVTFLGTVRHEQLPVYYNAADLCVIPSYYESFGLVALEALACGTPVVAMDVGDMKHIVRQGETGYVVPSNNPDLLAEKMTQALTRLSKNTERTAVIRQSVQRFRWSRVAEAVSRLCQEVVAEHLTPVP